MNIDIRKSIVANFQDADSEEIKDAIVSSIHDKDEVTLPGLGVFFELIRQNSTNDEQEKMIEKLKQNLNQS